MRIHAAVYRALLVLAALAILARLPWTSLQAIGDAPADDPARLVLGVLALAACVTSLLALNYPGRASVSLLLLPLALLWWHLGGSAAIATAAFSALFGNAFRRAPAAASVAGAARTVVALALGVAAGSWLANGSPAAVGTPLAAPFSAMWLLANAVFVLVVSVVDALLDALEARIGAAVPAMARFDFFTNVLLLPLATLLYVVGTTLGFERMAIVLAGFLALLFVVRTSINTRTLHESLQRLHRTVAAEREKLETLYLHSGEGIFTIDGQLRIASANPAMGALLGHATGELEGQRCALVCAFEDADGQHLCPERCPLLRAQAEQRPISQEVLYQPPEQPPKHLLLTYAAVGEPDQPLELGIGIARDITAQKETERLRDEFVSLVTHELRSPLTASMGYLSLLRQQLARAAGLAAEPSGGVANPEKLLSYVGRVEGAERHLLRLVNNLLDLARVERPELSSEQSTVLLHPLLEDAIENSAPLAREKHIDISLDAPEEIPALWTAELYVREVFGNLLSNAVKYTPEGGRVTVSVRVLAGLDTPAGEGLPRAAQWISIAVSDTGYGMSEQEQARLFTKFFRSGRPEVRQQRGTGLGLALTKAMVEKLDGTIGVQSAVGVGSTFTVTLPVLAEAPHPPAPSPTRGEGQLSAMGAAPPNP